jgi:exodeoxyribonuclease VII large subunit
VLDRGYALVLNAEGALVRSITAITPGQPLTTRLADGSFTSRVDSPAHDTRSTKTVRSKKQKN